MNPRWRGFLINKEIRTLLAIKEKDKNLLKASFLTCNQMGQEIGYILKFHDVISQTDFESCIKWKKISFFSFLLFFFFWLSCFSFSLKCVHIFIIYRKKYVVIWFALSPLENWLRGDGRAGGLSYHAYLQGWWVPCLKIFKKTFFFFFLENQRTRIKHSVHLVVFVSLFTYKGKGLGGLFFDFLSNVSLLLSWTLICGVRGRRLSFGGFCFCSWAGRLFRSFLPESPLGAPGGRPWPARAVSSA